ncbi:MAG: hypothetical protein QG635_57, partial [Bacteroidota bacterium]|nr:hypothetical protein [Bacteroidota bacterium]
LDKKKLKEEYKNMVPPKGVFTIKNNVTGRVLLGSSMNLKGIFPKYKTMLNNGIHFNGKLQEDWKQYGEDSFIYEVVEALEIKPEPDYNYDEDLKILEMLWLDKFRPLDEKTYNRNEKIRVV